MPLLGWFVFHRLGSDTYILPVCKNYDSSLNHSRDIIGGPKILSGLRDPEHALFKGHLSSVC